MDLASLLFSLALRIADLQQPRIGEVVTVIGGGPSIAIPAAVTVLGRAELNATPAATLDDALRSVPGFSLFRRSSSRVANPTTQGATLRGLAASGASRALVLADGIPLNDPVGGWVYWNRIPIAAWKDVSVARGAAGDVYGADALGGVVSIRSANEEGVRVLVEGGSDDTARLSAYGGGAYDQGMFFGMIEGFTTDGFITVPSGVRGPVDTPAASRHASAHAAANLPGGGVDFTVRTSLFGEARRNGTPLQRNSTRIGLVSVQASGLAGGNPWRGSGYTSTQDYEQTFSAVLAGRGSERQTSGQVVGATAMGAQVDYWWNGLRGVADFGVQLATRRVAADLADTPFDLTGAPLSAEQTDTAQLTAATAVQGRLTRGRVAAGGGVRMEAWRADQRRAQLVANPKLWATVAAGGGLTLRAALQSGFRGPTINELYRGFRVGNVATRANAALRPERARGIEGGISWRRTILTVRAVVFWSRVDEAIVNVTLPPADGLILRERQNAARIRAAGSEIEGELRVFHNLTFSAASSYTDSTFSRGPLTGLRVPQVARLQHAFGARGSIGRLRATLEWRHIGRQFDDDRNVFALDRSSMLDGAAGWQMTKQVELFAAVENALDEEQEVGRTPLRTLGLPRTTRAGMRFVFP